MATVEALLAGVDGAPAGTASAAGGSSSSAASEQLVRSANNRGVGLVTHALFAEDEAEAAQLLRRLVEAGSLVNHADRDGMTALHHAAIARSPALVTTLLELGADKSVKDAQGRTAADVLKSLTPSDHAMTAEDLKLAALF